MIILIIINIILTFSALCGVVTLDNKLDRVIDNQDIIKCIKKGR